MRSDVLLVAIDSEYCVDGVGLIVTQMDQYIYRPTLYFIITNMKALFLGRIRIVDVSLNTLKWVTKGRVY